MRTASIIVLTAAVLIGAYGSSVSASSDGPSDQDATSQIIRIDQSSRMMPAVVLSVHILNKSTHGDECTVVAEVTKQYKATNDGSNNGEPVRGREVHSFVKDGGRWTIR